MLKKIELYCLDVISEKKRGAIAYLIKAFLRGLSWFYRGAAFCRNWAFDQGWLPRYYPPVPVVISVGNIVAGGTGKTPVTLLLVKQFYQQYLCAILSRGYRSPAEHLAHPISLSRGDGPLYPASYCGDEPFLLAQNFPKAMVFVGRNRQKASTMAAKAGAKLIVLDDGMQYRYLGRDFEIIVVDAADPFGKGYFLPRGLLRENLKGLARADLIIANNVKDRAQYLTVTHQLARYTAAPIVAVHPTMAGIRDLNGKEIPSLTRTRIGIFCGIANPAHFHALLRLHEAVIVGESYFPDHHLPDQEVLIQFANHCKSLGAEYLVCTEKDRVKLSNVSAIPLPILWIKSKLFFVEGDAHWSAFLEKIKIRLEKDAAAFQMGVKN